MLCLFLVLMLTILSMFMPLSLSLSLSHQSESILEEGGLPRGFKLTFIFRENPYFTNRWAPCIAVLPCAAAACAPSFCALLLSPAQGCQGCSDKM